MSRGIVRWRKFRTAEPVLCAAGSRFYSPLQELRECSQLLFPFMREAWRAGGPSDLPRATRSAWSPSCTRGTSQRTARPLPSVPHLPVSSTALGTCQLAQGWPQPAVEPAASAQGRVRPARPLRLGALLLRLGRKLRAPPTHPLSTFTSVAQSASGHGRWARKDPHITDRECLVPLTL